MFLEISQNSQEKLVLFFVVSIKKDFDAPYTTQEKLSKLIEVTIQVTTIVMVMVWQVARENLERDISSLHVLLWSD